MIRDGDAIQLPPVEGDTSSWMVVGTYLFIGISNQTIFYNQVCIRSKINKSHMDKSFK